LGNHQMLSCMISKMIRVNLKIWPVKRNMGVRSGNSSTIYWKDGETRKYWIKKYDQVRKVVY